MPTFGNAPPIQSPFMDPITGQITEVWRIFLRTLSTAVGTLAPTDAKYWLSTSSATLTAAQNMGALASGYLKTTTSFGTATPSSVATIPVADVAGLPVLASGTYTPTLSNVANLSASTAYSCQWLQVGSVVTVSGKVDVDPVTTATDTQLGISLPVASDFANANECGGTAWAPGLTSEGGAILADATNNRATLQFKAVDISNAARYFSFSYRVI